MRARRTWYQGKESLRAICRRSERSVGSIESRRGRRPRIEPPRIAGSFNPSVLDGLEFLALLMSSDTSDVEPGCGAEAGGRAVPKTVRAPARNACPVAPPIDRAAVAIGVVSVGAWSLRAMSTPRIRG